VAGIAVEAFWTAVAVAADAAAVVAADAGADAERWGVECVVGIVSLEDRG